MTSEPPGRFDASESPQSTVAVPSSWRGSHIELSPQFRADLLNTDAWSDILATFGRTMRAAVALTDTRGHILGDCHNAQPVWSLIHGAAPVWAGCPFCITTSLPCTAVAESLQTGAAVMVHDQAGLTHVAVPLSLGTEHLGAIVAGQVFDRYPESLALRRVAKDFGVPAQQLWDVARKQPPVSSAILQASGHLLRALGHAFLQQRYAAILEAKLTEANGHFRLLVEGVRDHALFTVDPTGLVTSWNRGAERLLGYLEAEIVGRNFSCFFNPEDLQHRLPEKQLLQALEAGRAEDEGRHLRGNGKQFWANLNITALSQDAGPVSGFAVVIQDVTERRKIATILEEARQERARLQERFISHVSHELRTPLTAIYFFTTNVLDGLLGDLTPDQREHLTLALDNVKQLKEMVNDLLDITRVGERKLTIEPQHASPIKLIAEVLNTCRTNAAAKNITLRSEVTSDLPFVWAEPARVRQILINLIDNAIKFTPGGGTVTVNGRLLPEDDSFVCLTVSDTGCGINAENCALVFDRLAQVYSRGQASRSGLGLGLFIARELVLLHGGRIWLESQPGLGSTFYFTLPVFSLAKLCVHALTATNLESGSVTLITVDVAAVDGAVQADLLPEILRVLQGCIHSGKDVLLPSMSDAEPVVTFFIVACTDPSGSAAIARRIGTELRNFDNASRLKPVIASTTLLVEPDRPREEQIGEVTSRIDRLIQAHLKDREKPNG